MKKIDKISVTELEEMAKAMFGDFVKAVVDVEKKILIVEAEMHYDLEQVLLEEGSNQFNVWGINLYPSEFGNEKFIEYDSMINVRSRQGNMSRGVEDPEIRARIKTIVGEAVHG